MKRPFFNEIPIGKSLVSHVNFLQLIEYLAARHKSATGKLEKMSFICIFAGTAPAGSNKAMQSLATRADAVNSIGTRRFFPELPTCTWLPCVVLHTLPFMPRDVTCRVLWVLLLLELSGGQRRLCLFVILILSFLKKLTND
jgi:hypothetical protein